MKKNLAVVICGAAICLSLAACNPIREEKGYRIDAEQVARLETGVSTKEEVLELMGSPSSISTFQEKGDAWYYIGKTTEHYAFLEKDVLEQNIIVIEFDDSEVIKQIKNYNKEDSREIDLVDRTTPTGGNELGFFEQIFGNFGRFNPGAN